MNNATSIHENNLTELTLYPNPSTGELIIPIALQNYALNIFDFTGRNVFAINKVITNRNNFQELSNGLYLLAFSKDNKRITFRWIKSE